MSLVAYDASSDEESDNEDRDEVSSQSGQANVPEIEMKKILALPPPKTSSNTIETSNIEIIAENKTIESDEDDPDTLTISFNLPKPKKVKTTIVEEEDEFLKKKAIPSVITETPSFRKKGPVKITIPSLSNFADVDDDQNEKRGRIVGPELLKTGKPSGLLSLLPKPKSETMFSSTASKTAGENIKKLTNFVPYSVLNTKKIAEKSESSKKSSKIPKKGVVLTYSDSDDDEDETTGIDFFSLNGKEDLPEVSMNEINALVSKRAAKMSETSTKIENMVNTVPIETVDEYPDVEINTYYHQPQLDDNAMTQLCGSSAKRKRQDDVQIVDLSHEQVLPDRNEWMRNTLTASTEYQPKGRLTDDELIPGSKRKHQITYLAHQAKANESELQAMWALNRQTRRQTQSKYGF